MTKAVCDFNDTIAADLLTVDDVDGRACEVLSLACYRVTVLLKHKDSATCAEKFLRYLVRRSCSVTAEENSKGTSRR